MHDLKTIVKYVCKKYNNIHGVFTIIEQQYVYKQNNKTEVLWPGFLMLDPTADWCLRQPYKRLNSILIGYFDSKIYPSKWCYNPYK